jgi:hypothetical protein
MTHRAPDLFSAPRRFDLFTVLVAAAAYAVLFTIMRLLNFPVGAMAFIGGLCAAIAAGQALGEGRLSPRLASVFAAMIFWIIVAVVDVAVAWYSGTSDGELAARVAVAVISGIVWGVVSGYLVGVLVAGVFLVSFHLREGFASRRSRASVANRDQDLSPWDESPQSPPANPTD